MIEIEMMKLTKEYIAGFFDGEGSIGIYKRKDRNKGNGSCARIQLTQNKSKESTFILNQLMLEYGGNLSIQKTLSGNIKYNWQLNPKGVEKFLKDITPYLILKKSQALLILYWIKNRPLIKRDKSGKVILFSKEEIEFTENIIRLMKELKKKDIDIVMANQTDLVKILVKLEPLGVIKG